MPDEVASMTFDDITDTSFIVIWTQPYFTNGILTGTYDVNGVRCGLWLICSTKFIGHLAYCGATDFLHLHKPIRSKRSPYT